MFWPSSGLSAVHDVLAHMNGHHTCYFAHCVQSGPYTTTTRKILFNRARAKVSRECVWLDSIVAATIEPEMRRIRSERLAQQKQERLEKFKRADYYSRASSTG